MSMNSKPKVFKERELSLCASLFSAYQAIAADVDGSRKHFVEVLQTRTGSPNLQRLVARLILRFAGNFPSELERSFEVLCGFVPTEPAGTVRAAAQTATLQDALKGLGLVAAKLCQHTPGHTALQQAVEVLLRHFAPAKCGQLVCESATAAAALCSMFKECSRSCCIVCLQLLSQPAAQLDSSVCAFLHQHLFTPVPVSSLSSNPDLESSDADIPSLAEEAFQQAELVDSLTSTAQNLSGDVKDAAGWQKVLEQIISHLVPPLASDNPLPAVSLASPDHASSVDMVITPPPIPLASTLTPPRRQSPVRSQAQRASPARSSGSVGRSAAGSSPRLLPLAGRVQKRTGSSLRPRGVESPGDARRLSRDSPAFSGGGRRPSPHRLSSPPHAGLSTQWRPLAANPSPGVPPSPLPKPGMGITAVSRCIWIGGVPVSVREADLFKEASLIGDVLFIRFPDCPGQDEALVTFASFGGALLCWERMNGQCVFGGRPLILRFCPFEPLSPAGHEPPQPAHVYVPEVTTLAGEAAVFRDLDEGQAPRPEHSDIIRSAGAAGLLMRFSRPTMVGLVLHALQLPPRPASPGSRYGSPPRGFSPVRSMGKSPPRVAFERGPSRGGGLPGRGQSRLGPPGGGRHERTVWVGQLNSRVTEAELLQAFSQFGRILSHTIRRLTNCAYIDFDDSHAATLARRAMNGALLGGSALRVEFKGQHSNSAPPSREFSPRGRGRGLSPPGQSRGIRAPSGTAPREQQPSPSRFGRRSPPPSPTALRGQDAAARSIHPAHTNAPSQSRPPSPTNPAPPKPAPLPLIQSQNSKKAAPEQTGALPDRGDASVRVRSREADGEAAEEHAAKRPRASKWDQQDSDAVPLTALPSQAEGTQGRLQPAVPARQQGPTEPGSGPHPPNPPPASLAAAASAHLPIPAPLLPPHLIPDSGQQEPHGGKHSSVAPVLPGLRQAHKPSAQPVRVSPVWQGQLAKSGVPKCRAECIGVGGVDPALPLPPILDVCQRAPLSKAMDLPKQHAPQHVVVRCIVSTSSPKNAEHFHKFCQYLREKERAGVVEFGTEGRIRSLLLIPGTAAVYEQLHVQDPQQECLVAIATVK